MKVYFFHRALPQIAIANDFIVEMLLDELSLDVFTPALMFFIKVEA